MQQVQAEALQQPPQQHEAVVAEQDLWAGQLEGAAEAVADAGAEASVAVASGAIALQVVDAACQQQAGLLEQMHSLRLSSLREQAQASYGSAMMHTTAAQQAGAAARPSEETSRAMQLALESRLAVSNATAAAAAVAAAEGGFADLRASVQRLMTSARLQQKRRQQGQQPGTHWRQQQWQ
jgi:hypothetical protein